MPGDSLSLVNACRQAAASARANRLRSGLAALATAAAVATIVVVISGLDGVRRYAEETASRTFGSDTFVIAQLASGQLSRTELAERLARNPPIRRADARFLDRVSNGVTIYAPTAQRSVQVVAGSRSFENAALNGTTARLADIRVIEVDQGRFLNDTEVANAAQVAVIGSDIATGLFPGRDAVGRQVRIAGRGFDVVGVVKRQGQAGGVTLDRYLYIPLPAYERAFGSPGSLQLFARAADGFDARAGEDRAHVSMRARRQLAPGEADTFDIITPQAARNFVLQLASRVGAAALPISFMALLTSIVVVANTALVSVTERTREIGIRRAVGASRVQILTEVLAESVFTAAIGGGVGVVVAVGALTIASTALDFALTPAWPTIGMAMSAAALTGLAAGYFPARQAARLDVIAALHTE
jgi:putative ABC transport system permease protein